MTETSGRYDKRNFFFNSIEGALWVAGVSLISPQTVLPALITRLGGGNVEIGALGVITFFGLFAPQIFAARFGQKLEWKKFWVVALGTSQRIVILLATATLFFFAADYPSLSVGLLLVFFALNQIVLGITTPIWFDFYSKLTPIKRRGLLVGVRNSIAGALSFGCTILLTWLLATYSFPANYTLAFFGAFLLQLASIFFQMQLKEEFPSKTVQQKSWQEYFLLLKGVIRQNKEFVKFLTASGVLIISSMSFSFLTVYALKYFNAGESVVGEFTMLVTGGQITGAIINGYISDKIGNKLALTSSAVMFLAACIAALFAPTLAWFRLAMFFSGMNLGSEVMTRYNLAIEYGTIEHRALYVGLMNTLLAPFYLSGLLGGWISNSFGYETVFAISIIFSLIGILLLVIRVKEPRHIPGEAQYVTDTGI